MDNFHSNEAELRRGEGRPPLAAREFRASGWSPVLSGTLQGFFDLQLPSGLKLKDCTLHQKGDRRWIGLPGKPQIEDGRHRKDPATGKGLYTPTVEIPARSARDKFMEQALAAVDRMLGT